MVLEAAVNGQADAIVIFNIRDFGQVVTDWFGVAPGTPAKAANAALSVLFRTSARLSSVPPRFGRGLSRVFPNLPTEAGRAGPEQRTAWWR